MGDQWQLEPLWFLRQRWARGVTSFLHRLSQTLAFSKWVMYSMYILYADFQESQPVRVIKTHKADVVRWGDNTRELLTRCDKGVIWWMCLNLYDKHLCVLFQWHLAVIGNNCYKGPVYIRPMARSLPICLLLCRVVWFHDHVCISWIIYYIIIYVHVIHVLALWVTIWAILCLNKKKTLVPLADVSIFLSEDLLETSEIL